MKNTIEDRVVVSLDKQDGITKSGLITSTDKDKPLKGTVVLSSEVNKSPAKGDKVLLLSGKGVEFKEDGEDYLIIERRELLLIL